MRYQRKLDELHRIVLPKETASFGWGEGTELDIVLRDDHTVLLQGSRAVCSLCGQSGDGLITVERGKICRACLEAANSRK